MGEDYGDSSNVYGIEIGIKRIVISIHIPKGFLLRASKGIMPLAMSI